jgi:photosystem II stability/assembly factor-like uncharacterized protein
MLRKYPVLANLVAIVVVVLYLGGLYFIVGNYLQPKSSPNGNTTGLFGSLNSGTQISNRLLATTDGGKTWLGVASNNNTSFTALSCQANGTCFAADIYSNIYRSADAGKNWTLRYNSYNSSENYIHKLTCPEINTCYALVYNRQGDIVMVTHDGGANWANSLPGTAASQLLDLSCPASSTCYLVGRAGRILNTTNGGSNWSLQEAGTERTLTSISCANSNECVVVGEVGTILTTTNGGGKWAKQNFGYAKDLTAISCPIATTCFALGGTLSSGNILSTTNGGASWKTLDYGSDEGHSVLTCPTSTLCYAGAKDGRFRITTDGGTKWISQSSGSTNGFRALSCPNATTCYALTQFNNGYDDEYYGDY